MQEGQRSPAMTVTDGGPGHLASPQRPIVTRDPVAGYRLQVPGPGDLEIDTGVGVPRWRVTACREPSSSNVDNCPASDFPLEGRQEACSWQFPTRGETATAIPSTATGDWPHVLEDKVVSGDPGRFPTGLGHRPRAQLGTYSSVSGEDMTAPHAPTTSDDNRSPSDRAVSAELSLVRSSTLNSHCRMGAESPNFEPPELRPTGSEKPEGMTAMGVIDTMGHPEAQEDREQSGHMGGYEAAPMGHPGETPSPGVTAHLTLGSVRPYRHEPQLVPVRGSVTAVAETGSVLQV